MAKKGNKTKWVFLWIILIVALVFFALNFKNIIPPKKNVTNAYIDPAIYKEFENGTKWVRVIVDLNSNEAADELLKSLTKSEFNFTSKSYWGNSLYGFTSKRGLTEILSNQNVTAVYLSGVSKNYA